MRGNSHVRFGAGDEETCPGNGARRFIPTLPAGPTELSLWSFAVPLPPVAPTPPLTSDDAWKAPAHRDSFAAKLGDRPGHNPE